jgi:hypothetical protein
MGESIPVAVANCQAYLATLDAWQDDERTAAMFSMFPEANVMTTAIIQVRVAYWADLLRRCTAHGFLDSAPAGETSRLSFTPQMLQMAFKRKGVSPLCLKSVLVRVLDLLLGPNAYVRRAP